MAEEATIERKSKVTQFIGTRDKVDAETATLAQPPASEFLPRRDGRPTPDCHSRSWIPLSSTNTLASPPCASTAQETPAGPSSRPSCIHISRSRTHPPPLNPSFAQPATSDTTSSRLTSFSPFTHAWSPPQTP